MSILDRITARVHRNAAAAQLGSNFAAKQQTLPGTTAGNGLNRVNGMPSLGTPADADGVTTFINNGRPAAANWQPSNAAGIVTTSSASGAASSGSGALVAHNLDGAYHIGPLNNNQAPQFLLIDGTPRPHWQPQRRQRHHHRRHRPQRPRRQRQRPPRRRCTRSMAPATTPASCPGPKSTKPAAPWPTLKPAPTATHRHRPRRPPCPQSHSIVSSSDHTLTGAKWVLVGATATNTLGLITPITSSIGPIEGILKSDAAGAIELVKLRTQTIDTNTGQSLTLQPADYIIFVARRQSGAPERRQGIPHRQLHQRFRRQRLSARPGRHHHRQDALEIDNLTVRGTMTSTNWSSSRSAPPTAASSFPQSAKVASATVASGTSYKIVVTPTPRHSFLVGDLIRAQRVNPALRRSSIATCR